MKKKFVNLKPEMEVVPMMLLLQIFQKNIIKKVLKLN